jgi:hypothetical protein
VIDGLRAAQKLKDLVNSERKYIDNWNHLMDLFYNPYMNAIRAQQTAAEQTEKCARSCAGSLADRAHVYERVPDVRRCASCP